MTALAVRIEPLADSTLLAQFGEEPRIDPALAATVARIAQALIDRQLAGVRDIVPSYCTILIDFDLLTADIPAIEQAVYEEAATADTSHATPLRRVSIPVCYGGEYGPDLEEFAEAKGLTADEIIAIHGGPEYLVAVMGFAPGWAYLLGVDPRLQHPRRASPRIRVPAGSVATAMGQTGVYSLPTPGGWWLLGRTPVKMFDPDRADPFMFHTGDAVKFIPVSAKDYEQIAADVERGELGAQIELLGAGHAG